MSEDPIFEVFVNQRMQLIEQLDTARDELDYWIELHRASRATLAEMAWLEGLLAKRRELLGGLLKLDDGLMDHLVTERGQEP